MKKLTFIFLGVFCFVSFIQAQNTASLEVLLERLSQKHMGSITDVFTPNEIEILKAHFYSQIDNQENESILINRRMSSTQAVDVVTAVDINPTDLSGIEELVPAATNEFEGAGVVRRNPIDGVYIVDNANNVWLRGLGTGTYDKIGVVSNVPANESITGLEFLSGPQGALYGISTNGVDSSTLLEINTETWNATQVGNPDIVLPINLGRDGENNLFTVDIDNNLLFKINYSNAEETPIGDIGFDANYGQGMCWDPFDNKLYLAAFNNSLFDSELREVNLITGWTTSLGTIVPGTLMQFGWGSMYDQDILSAANTSLQEVILYPNPASNSIRLTSSQEIQNITIFNLYGQKLWSDTTTSMYKEITINHLATGTYLIKVSTKTESGVLKFLKQ